MKVSRSEFGHEYGEGVYRFGYCEYAKFEKGDTISDFYNAGYLPRSTDPEIQDTFYMARSARVPLQTFAFTSENRRIAKRFDGTLTVRELNAREMPEEIKKLFVDYFRKRHGEKVMPESRLEGILATSLPLALMIYERDDAALAAVLEIKDETLGHFWYSAYDLALIEQSLGMWLMLDGARRAQEAGLAHYYLGTVYGPKALYKANLNPLEFWDGVGWSNDLPLLKKLARQETK